MIECGNLTLPRKRELLARSSPPTIIIAKLWKILISRLRWWLMREVLCITSPGHWVKVLFVLCSRLITFSRKWFRIDEDSSHHNFLLADTPFDTADFGFDLLNIQ